MSRRTAGVFIAGTAFGVAVTYSIFSRKKYPTFMGWWNAEGLPIWMIAGILIYEGLDSN